MLRTTIGNLLVNQALPEDLRQPEHFLDKKGLAALLHAVAVQHPEKYADVSKRLSDIGRQVATETGGDSFGLEHLSKAAAGKKYSDLVRNKVHAILADDRLSDEQRHAAIIRAAGDVQTKQANEIMAESLAAKSPLAKQIISGSRGNAVNLATLRGSDMLYADSRGNIVPVPVLHSYSEGLKPVEYWAGAYGARKGVTDVKFATRDAGYLSKLLNQVSHRLMVVNEDNDIGKNDLRGLPVETADADNEGALLARDAGGYPRNTVLTPRILKELTAKKIDRIAVRSPTVGGSPEGGVYARDVGVRERGVLPGAGEQVGLTAAQALSEPLSQSQLCLGVGTLVRMADWTTRAIEDIEVGERVMGSDRNGNTFPVRVLKCYDNGERQCVRTVFRKAKIKQLIELISTPDHKILGKTRQWGIPQIGVFPVGTKCVGFSAAVIPRRKGRRLGRYVKKLAEDTSAEYFHRQTQTAVGNVPTFDIEVDHPDHLFVLANGLIVSNSSKHGGGVAGQSKGVSGFKAIDALAQIPATVPGMAAHADTDGLVEGVEKAPAGGHYVTINAQNHYVGEGLDLKVKRGDRVEAGDAISEGGPDPEIVVRHKGIGEGRRYLVHAMKAAMQSAGMKPHRRNVELLARGLINHVRLTDELGGHVAGDVIPYSTLEHTYEPRKDAEDVKPEQALNRYLETPALHYTIGTKIRPSVIKELKHFGIDKIKAHREPPPFEPEMVRAMASLHHDPDWMTRMYGSGLKGGLLDAVHRGAISDEAGTSFVPSLARAVDFGDVGLVRQPAAGTAPEDLVMQKRKPTDRPTAPHALDIQPKKQTPSSYGGLGSLFKLSTDRVAQLDAAKKLAEKIARQVGPLHQIKTAEEPASVPGAAPLQSGQLTSAPTHPAGGESPSPPAAHSTLLHPTHIPAPTPPHQVLPGTAPAAPAPSAQTAAPPGQVHPARSHGMWHSGEDPELLTRFTQNAQHFGRQIGGEAGADLGGAIAFGSGLDYRAVGDLTRGGNDPRSTQHGFTTGGGGRGWTETMRQYSDDPAGTPRASTAPPAATAPPVSQFTPPAAQQRSQLPAGHQGETYAGLPPAVELGVGLGAPVAGGILSAAARTTGVQNPFQRLLRPQVPGTAPASLWSRLQTPVRSPLATMPVAPVVPRPGVPGMPNASIPVANAPPVSLARRLLGGAGRWLGYAGTTLDAANVGNAYRLGQGQSQGLQQAESYYDSIMRYGRNSENQLRPWSALADTANLVFSRFNPASNLNVIGSGTAAAGQALNAGIGATNSSADVRRMEANRLAQQPPLHPALAGLANEPDLTSHVTEGGSENQLTNQVNRNLMARPAAAANPFMFPANPGMAGTVETDRQSVNDMRARAHAWTQWADTTRPLLQQRISDLTAAINRERYATPQQQESLRVLRIQLQGIESSYANMSAAASTQPQGTLGTVSNALNAVNPAAHALGWFNRELPSLDWTRWGQQWSNTFGEGTANAPAGSSPSPAPTRQSERAWRR